MSFSHSVLNFMKVREPKPQELPQYKSVCNRLIKIFFSYMPSAIIYKSNFPYKLSNAAFSTPRPQPYHRTKKSAPRSVQKVVYTTRLPMLGRANFFWPPSNAAGPVVGAWVGRTTVLFPMTSVPPKFMLTGVPGTIAPFPPGRIVVPSIAKPVGLAVMICPATVTISAGVMTADESVCVLEPTTASIAPGAN